jgi:hypothetical protein
MASQPIVPPQTGIAKGTVLPNSVLPIAESQDVGYSSQQDAYSTNPESSAPGIDIYDISGAAPVLGSIHPDDVAQAVSMGTHSFPKGRPVDVISPDGQPGSIPPEDAPNAFRQGYTYATPDAINQIKYGSGAQQALAGLEAAGRGASFGLSTGAELATGLTTPEAIRGREEANPVTAGAGEVAGLIGSAFIPGVGEANILGKAGNVASRAVGLGAEKGFLNTVGDAALRGAFENALYQVGPEMHKAFVQDPGQTAETAAAHIGLAGVLGGVFGGTIGAGIQGAKAVGKAISPVFVSEVDRPLLEAGDLGTAIKNSEALPDSYKDKVLKSLDISKEKGNSAEIRKAMKDLGGAPETPGMFLEHPAIAPAVDLLANSPYTISGNAVRSKLDNAHAFVDDVLQKATSSANNMSKEEVGAALQSGLSTDIRNTHTPQKIAFDDLRASFSHIPVDKPEITAITDALNSIKEVKLGPGTDEGRLVRQVLKTVQNAKTADDLDIIRNMASLKKESERVDPLGWLKSKIRDVISETQEEAVLRHAKSFPRNDEAGSVIENLVSAARKAKADYAPYIKKVGELSEWLGKGKIHGTEDALAFMNEKLTASDVSKRLFSSSKDPAFQRFFEREFPEQARLMREYRRAEMRADAALNGEFNANKFYKNFEELEPEAQKALYTADEIKKIKAAQVYSAEAFPKSFNPSGTSHMNAYRAAHEGPKAFFTANIRDKAIESFINMAGNPKVRNALSLGTQTGNAIKALDKGVKAVFDKAKDFPASAPVSVLTRNKLDKLVTETVKDPQRLLNVGANNPIPDYNTSFAGVSARAVQYLNALKPSKSDTTAIYGGDSTPSEDQKARYNRALDLAQKPSLVLESIRNGSVTPDDIKTINVIYPAWAESVRGKLNARLIEAKADHKIIPYSTRLGISMFLGQPIDATMTPDSIARAQVNSKSQLQAAPTTPGGTGRVTASAGRALEKIPSQYNTPDQSAQRRQVNRR